MSEIIENTTFIDNLKEWISLESIVLGNYDRQIKSLDHNKFEDECTQKEKEDCTDPCSWYNSSKKQNEMCVNKSFLSNIRPGNTVIGLNKTKYDIEHTDSVELVRDSDNEKVKIYYVIFKSPTQKKIVVFNSGAILDIEAEGFTNTGSKTLKEMIGELIEIIKNENGKNYIVSGHSMGAQFAMHIASTLYNENIGVFNKVKFICSGMYKFLDKKVLQKFKNPSNIHIFYTGDVDKDSQSEKFDIDPFIFNTVRSSATLYLPIYVLKINDDYDEDDEDDGGVEESGFNITKIANERELKSKANEGGNLMHDWSEYYKRFKLLIQTAATEKSEPPPLQVKQSLYRKSIQRPRTKTARKFSIVPMRFNIKNGGRKTKKRRAQKTAKK